MSHSIERLNVDAEVPDEAFEDHVIDLDFHASLDREEMLGYVEDDLALEKLTTEHGPTPIPAKWDSAYGVTSGENGLFTQGRAEDADDVREACKRYAIDEPVVNFGMNNLPKQHHPVLKNALVQAGNDYMLDKFADEGLYTAGAISKWDVDHALEELDRWSDEQQVVAAYSWFDSRTPWGSEQFDPIFEKLVSEGLPLILHGSSSTFISQHDYLGDESLTWTEALGFEWPMYAQMNVVNMIMRGVFDRFPDLNVVLLEGGHWWVPFLRYRMDEFYEMHPEDVQITPRKYETGDHYLDKSPSDYLRENIYLGTQPFALPRTSRGAENLLELSMAEDVFVYTSDWPHQTIDPPTWFYASRAFDDELRNAIIHENAEEILRI